MKRLVFVSLLLASISLADPPVPTRGPLNVSVEPTTTTRASLAAGSARRGATFGMVVRFASPSSGDPVLGRVVFAVLGGSVSAPMGQATGAGPDDQRGQYEVPFTHAGAAPVELAFDWTPTGNDASTVAVRVELGRPGPVVGSAGFMLAFGENAVASETTPTELITLQRQALRDNPERTRRRRTATAVAPFNPGLFPEAMQRTSTTVRLPTVPEGSQP